MLKTIIGALLLSVGSLSFALEKDSCKPSVCIDDRLLKIEVKRISKRGKIVIVHLKYTGKSSINISGMSVSFTYNKKPVGYATILDAEGMEFTIPADKIPNFSLKRGQEKNISLKFKAGKESDIKEPFDLTIKAGGGHGEISFFDLKNK